MVSFPLAAIQLWMFVDSQAAPSRKQLVTDLIAVCLYWFLAQLAALAEFLGLRVGSFPLNYYRLCSFYTIAH